LVTKQFTFVTPFSRSLIAIVASLFDECYITKPKTSRPTNSEVYLVAKGFNGISGDLAKALLDRCDAYKQLNKLPTTWGSLISPEVLAQVDAEILSAAQEVHGEQQVEFLNEIANAYRLFNQHVDIKKIVGKYENDAQKTWLNENPLMVISSDENLNNKVENIELVQNQYETTLEEDEKRYTELQKQLSEMNKGEQAQTIAPIEEISEESILMPEENKKEEEGGEEEGREEEGENKGNEGEGQKKTIKFNI